MKWGVAHPRIFNKTGCPTPPAKVTHCIQFANFVYTIRTSPIEVEASGVVNPGIRTRTRQDSFKSSNNK